MDRVTDQDLMRQVQDGDVAAFERVVDRHKRSVFGLCFTMLRSREDAEEASQDTFLKLFRGRDLYDPSRPLQPWILRIAGNTCRDLIRRRADSMAWPCIPRSARQWPRLRRCPLKTAHYGYTGSFVLWIAAWRSTPPS